MARKEEPVPKTPPRIELRFRLGEAELLECFECLDSPREGRSKKINEGVLTLISAAFIVLYAVKPQEISYMLMAVMSVAALFTMHYYPARRRRRNARESAKQNGQYHIKMWDNGVVLGENTPALRIGEAGDKLYEGKQVFAMFLDGRYRFCVPKRLLKKGDEQWLRGVLESGGLKTIDTK